jgi:hypothetical protein
VLVVEANEYPDLITRYALETVPKIVINDRIEILGTPAEAQLVEQVVASVRVEANQR